MVYFSCKGSLAEYIPESRNLLTHDVNKNKNNLKYKGKANIIHILEKLPKTKHDFGSFIIDIPLANVSIKECLFYLNCNCFFFILTSSLK